MDVAAIQKQTGLSAIELARRIGVSGGHLADLKSGRRKLTVPIAAKLEEAAGVTGLVDEVVRAQIEEAA